MADAKDIGFVVSPFDTVQSLWLQRAPEATKRVGELDQTRADVDQPHRSRLPKMVANRSKRHGRVLVQPCAFTHRCRGRSGGAKAGDRRDRHHGTYRQTHQQFEQAQAVLPRPVVL